MVLAECVAVPWTLKLKLISSELRLCCRYKSNMYWGMWMSPLGLGLDFIPNIFSRLVSNALMLLSSDCLWSLLWRCCDGCCSCSVGLIEPLWVSSRCCCCRLWYGCCGGCFRCCCACPMTTTVRTPSTNTQTLNSDVLPLRPHLILPPPAAPANTKETAGQNCEKYKAISNPICWNKSSFSPRDCVLSPFHDTKMHKTRHADLRAELTKPFRCIVMCLMWTVHCQLYSASESAEKASQGFERISKGHKNMRFKVFASLGLQYGVSVVHLQLVATPWTQKLENRLTMIIHQMKVGNPQINQLYFVLNQWKKRNQTICPWIQPVLN